VLGRTSLQIRDGLATHSQLLCEGCLGDLCSPASLGYSQTHLKGLQEPVRFAGCVWHFCNLYDSSKGTLTHFRLEMGIIGDIKFKATAPSICP